MFLELKNRKREETEKEAEGFAYYIVVSQTITLDEFLEIKSMVVGNGSVKRDSYCLYGPMPCEKYSYDDVLEMALDIAQYETALDWVSSMQIRPIESLPYRVSLSWI